MFFRIKKSGRRGYVQVVENRRVNGTVQQSVIGRSWVYRRRGNAPQRHGDDTHATNGETLLHAQHAALRPARGFRQGRARRHTRAAIARCDKAYRALAVGEVDVVGSEAHAALSVFPAWGGVKLFCVLGQGMYWFLVMRADIGANRNDVTCVQCSSALDSGCLRRCAEGAAHVALGIFLTFYVTCIATKWRHYLCTTWLGCPAS